jgi:hypothetical protein
MRTNKTVRVAVLALSLGATGAAAAGEDTQEEAAQGEAAQAEVAVVAQAGAPAGPTNGQPGGPSPEDPTVPPAAPRPEGEARGDTLLDRLPIQFGGYFWVDTGAMRQMPAVVGSWDKTALYMQGRFALSAMVERDFASSFFGRAKVDFLGLVNEFANSQYEAHTLDAYVMVGEKQKWDVQVGRFLAWEVYRRGQGIELWTAEEAGVVTSPSLGMYWLQVARGYRNQTGQAAVHYYPTDFLGIEVSSIYGQVQSTSNNLGIRPVVDLTLGRFKAVVGAEYLSQFSQSVQDKGSEAQWGYAGRMEYRFPVVTLGVNYARGSINQIRPDETQETIASKELETFGGYSDIDFGPHSIGLGYHRTSDLNVRGEFRNQDQAFVSYLYNLPIKGLSAKVVVGTAQARVQNLDARTEYFPQMRSVRLRLAYDFN